MDKLRFFTLQRGEYDNELQSQDHPGQINPSKDTNEKIKFLCANHREITRRISSMLTMYMTVLFYANIYYKTSLRGNVFVFQVVAWIHVIVHECVEIFKPLGPGMRQLDPCTKAVTVKWQKTSDKKTRQAYYTSRSRWNMKHMIGQRGHFCPGISDAVLRNDALAYDFLAVFQTVWKVHNCTTEIVFGIWYRFPPRLQQDKAGDVSVIHSMML